MAGSAAEPIGAIASAPGSAGRGVLRLSGAKAGSIGAQLLNWSPEIGRGTFEATLDGGDLNLPAWGLWMPGPRSFTREDVLELHLPGNRYLVSKAMALILRSGARLAEPGEFTRRAFLNGRLDLTRAEGILALVQAQSRSERRAATALLFGGLQERLGSLRTGVDSLRALCEASLDFDESDTGHVPVPDLLHRLHAIEEQLAEALSWEIRREGPRPEPLVVLAGAPNAGKSTLFNALTGSEFPALVENQAGSTRDTLHGAWQLSKVLVRLADTAGLESARGSELLEQVQTMAEAERERADCMLCVVNAADPVWPQPDPGQIRILVWSQVDRPGVETEPPVARRLEFSGGWVACSAVDRKGVSLLAGAVEDALEGQAWQGNAARGLAERHVQALRSAQESVSEVRTGFDLGAPLDLIAEDLRQATDALDGISGRTTAEDLLSRIFGQFCIGK
ncbi:MAG: 50S ribosome-binding GTPase [Planctomycetota bacterium]|nr:50S ribosome-binding GTPase [Planctomycetota bacterium]